VREQAVIDTARRWATKSPITGWDWVDCRKELRQVISELDELDSLDERAAFAPGSATSEAAAWPIRGSVRRRILDECRSIGLHPHLGGLTDDELERRLGRSHTTVSSARNYLVNAGWLMDSGKVRQTRQKRDATVWTLTPAAIQRMLNSAKEAS